MIYSKTPLGQSALQSRSVPLTPRLRLAFILFDGKRQTHEVLKATAGLGFTPDDVSHLVSLGLIAPVIAAPGTPVPGANADSTVPTEPAVSSSDTPSVSADGLPTVSAQAHYSKAYPVATRLTAGLGLRGFRLNLAVEAAGDLDKLKELAPRIRDAVGPEKFLELEKALYY